MAIRRNSCSPGCEKLVECDDPKRRPSEATEVSYTEMQVRSESAIRKLVAGEFVSVMITDFDPDELKKQKSER